MWTFPADPAERVPVVLLCGVTALLVAAHYLSAGRSPYAARAIGVLFLGPGSVALAAAAGLGLDRVGFAGEPLRAAALGAGLGLAIQPVLALSARRLRDDPPGATRPELALPAWTWRDWALNAATWTAYLLAYEACFRGVLLQGLAAHQAPWVATAGMLGLYVLYHLTKDAAETVGSYLMAFVFAALALDTASFVGPFVAHVLIAVGNDTWILVFQRKLPGLRATAPGPTASPGT